MSHDRTAVASYDAALAPPGRHLLAERARRRTRADLSRSARWLVTVAFLGLALLGVAAAPGLASLVTSARSSFVVNSTSDEADANTADGVCATASGSCTLRAAIEQANATPEADGIAFDLAGAPPHLIAPASPLPQITAPLTIDGFSEPDATDPDPMTGRFAPAVVLDGSAAGAAHGLVVAAPDVRIEGLSIVRFAGAGVKIRGDASVERVAVERNFLGIDLGRSDCLVDGAAGTTRGNDWGVVLSGATSFNGVNRNVVVCNTSGGVRLGEGATNNTVEANAIGVRTTAESFPVDFGNGGEGVLVVGGTTANNDIRHNVVAYNGTGIAVMDGAPQTSIVQNEIGLNDGAGIRLGRLQEPGSGATDTEIFGNGIGLFRQRTTFPNISRSQISRNGGQGLLIAESGNTTVGSPLEHERNVISGNEGWGVEINGPSATGNRLVGNYIGTAADGSGDAFTGNLAGGVLIRSARDNTIGGAGEGEGNLIAENEGRNPGDPPAHGVAVIGGTDNGIYGNRIGVGLAGEPLLNRGAGVYVERSAGTRVGPSGSPRGANIIAFNAGAGVQIGADPAESSMVTYGNTVGINAIYGNAVGNSVHGMHGLGIDLGGDGVTANDAADADDGPNRLTNRPVITEISEGGAGYQVRLEMPAEPAVFYDVRIFQSDQADPTGAGEGQEFLKQVTGQANGAGMLHLLTDPIPEITPGKVLTATATRAEANGRGSTGEFSDAFAVPPAGQLTVTSAADPGDGTCDAAECTLREAITAANADADANTILFAIPETGLAREYPVAVTSALPAITGPLTVLGFTQADSYRGETGFRPSVMLVGTGAGEGAAGLTIRSSDVVVEGLHVERFDGSGIRVEGEVTGVVLRENYVGGTAGLSCGGEKTGNGEGITLSDTRGASVHGNYVLCNDAGIVVKDDARESTLTHNTVDDNAHVGIWISKSSETLVRGNVVTRSDYVGVLLEEASDTELFANHIGADAAGEPAGNGLSGVGIIRSFETEIGSNEPGDANLIAYNLGNGVTVGLNAEESESVRHEIRENRIFGNGSLGIDLGFDGVDARRAPNGPGPNQHINWPLLSSVTTDGGVRVYVTAPGAPKGRYTVRFYQSAEADGSGHGEGETYLGRFEVSANASGLLDFRTDPIPGALAGRYLTATITDTNGNTSEFGNALLVQAPLALEFTPNRSLLSVGTPGTSTYGTFTDIKTFDGMTTLITLDGAEKPFLRRCFDYDDLSGTPKTCETVDVQAGTITLTIGGKVQSTESLGVIFFRTAQGIVVPTPPGTVPSLMMQDPYGAVYSVPSAVVDAEEARLVRAGVRMASLDPAAVRALGVLVIISRRTGIPLISDDGSTIISHNGGQFTRERLLELGATEAEINLLVGPDGASLVGPDGASLKRHIEVLGLVGPDGASLIGMDGASLIALAARLIGNDAGSFAALSGNTSQFYYPAVAPVVGQNGAGILVNNGGNAAAFGKNGAADDSLRAGPGTKLFVAFVPEPRLDARVLLQGALAPDGAPEPMHTELLARGALSAAQPYGTAPYDSSAFAVPHVTFFSESFQDEPTDVVDWVVVELRNGPDRDAGIFRRVAILLADGRIVDTDLEPVRFSGVGAGSYYVAVYHRNHLPVVSAEAYAFETGEEATPVAVDFAAAGVAADAATVVEVEPGRFALRTGDVDADGVLAETDLAAWAAWSGSVYSPADLDLSGVATASDYHERLLPALGITRPAEAPAPGTVDGHLAVTHHPGAGMVTAVVQLQAGTPDADLGTSTLQIRFDPSALLFDGGTLSVPTGGGGGVRYDTTAAVTVAGPGLISVNLDLVETLDGRGISLGSGLRDVATLQFRIRPEGGSGAVEWALREVYDGPGGAGGRYAPGTFETAVPVEEGPVPPAFALDAAWPNPASGATTLAYSLPAPTHIRVVVFDLLGREVAVLADEHRPAGHHAVTFDAGRLASGLYLVRVEASGEAQTQRVMVVR